MKADGLFVSTLFFGLSVQIGGIFVSNFAAEFTGDTFLISILYTMVAVFVMLLSFFIGVTSDRRGKRVIFIRLTSGLGIIINLLHYFITSYWELFVLRSLIGIVLAGQLPVMLSYLMDRRKESLGNMLSYYTAGWLIASVSSGIISQIFGVRILFIIAALAEVPVFLLSFRLQERKAVLHSKSKLNKAGYIPFLLRNIGLTAVWAIYPLFIFSIGGNFFIVGMLTSVNMLTQVYFMSKVNSWSRKVRSSSLVLIGNITSLGVILGFWLSYDYIFIVPVNILLGISWSCLYVGTILEVTGTSDLNKGRNVGAVQSTRSLAEIIGPVIGGLIANAVGIRNMIGYMSSFALAAVIASVLLMRNGK